MAQQTVWQIVKKVALKAVNYLNIGFLGYEVSEITTKPQKNEEAIYKSAENPAASSINHAFIVILFCLLICILMVIIYAIRIMLALKKAKKSSVTHSATVSV